MADTRCSLDLICRPARSICRIGLGPLTAGRQQRKTPQAGYVPAM